ncbi:28 kDa ribonucleoprotein, chloroplastic-like [Rutidosis leptorrhynchoides]|uniref:28 kDa ribonucleoprotein, chloroplastic-like n=1 Tax=Rutidosis leptorrhynchoides TaxID=125765 RepID=UPI003A98E3A0
MALLRFVCTPSASIFTNKQFFQPLNPNSSSLQPLSLSASFPNPFIHSQKPNSLIFHTQSAIEATQIQNSIESIEQKEDDNEEVEGSRTRLLAQNVNWTCTADDIRPLFERYGTVVDIEISMYSRTKNRGLVFVSMGSHEEALAAFTNLQSYEFMGRPLNLTWAKPKKEKKSSAPAQPKAVPVHNLFVANLPYQARSKDLMEFFSAENTNVVSAEIIFNEKPRASAGYGFVSFNTKQEAEAALSAFQGKVFMGRAIRVSPSKRFLRQATKEAVETNEESSKAQTEGEQTQMTETEA